MNISHGQAVGQRPYQEDRYSIIEDRENDQYLLSVFDGHGGCKTVDMLMNSIHESYERHKHEHRLNLMNDLYIDFDELTKENEDGSTASLVLITKDHLTAAVLGDSPIQVLFKNGREVTLPEHNVRSNPEESDAAIARGGVISNGYLFDSNSGWNATGIQMSRVLGDRKLRRVTNRTPEIFTFNREDVSSLLIASDGLIDPAHQVSHFLLTKHIQGPELIEKYKDSFDNVTAIVVQF